MTVNYNLVLIYLKAELKEFSFGVVRASNSLSLFFFNPEPYLNTNLSHLMNSW